MLQNVFKSLCTKCSQCEYHANYSHQMPDFSFKMHQIQCRLGLRPDPAGGVYSATPRPPSWIWGGKGKMEDEGQGRKEERKEKGKRGRGREGELRSAPPCQNHRSATAEIANTKLWDGLYLDILAQILSYSKC